jgi:glycyl-tRNA synthetase alpha subunit
MSNEMRGENRLWVRVKVSGVGGVSWEVWCNGSHACLLLLWGWKSHMVDHITTGIEVHSPAKVVHYGLTRLFVVGDIETRHSFRDVPG